MYRATTLTVWVHEYKPATWSRGDRHSGYIWRELPVTDVEYKFHGVSWFNKKEHRTRVSADDLASAVLELNGLKADSVDKQITERLKYVGWLKKTVAEWAPHPEKLRATE